MENALSGNTLEIAIIGFLGAIIVAFITLGGVAIFRLGNKIDRVADDLVETKEELSEKIAQSHQELSEKIAQSHQELSEKIAQSHQELSEKIDRSIRELRDDLTRQMDHTAASIVSTLVNHTHPRPGEPPVFTVPPPVSPSHPEPDRFPVDD